VLWGSVPRRVFATRAATMKRQDGCVSLRM